MNININEKTRQDLIDLLNIDKFKLIPSTFVNNAKNIQSPRKLELQQIKSLGLPIDPDQTSIGEKPLYNVEMPVYQGEENKEIFLKYT